MQWLVWQTTADYFIDFMKRKKPANKNNSTKNILQLLFFIIQTWLINKKKKYIFDKK